MGDTRYPLGDTVMRLQDLTLDIEEYEIAQLAAPYTSPYRYAGVGFLFFGWEMRGIHLATL